MSPGPALVTPGSWRAEGFDKSDRPADSAVVKPNTKLCRRRHLLVAATLALGLGSLRAQVSTFWPHWAAVSWGGLAILLLTVAWANQPLVRGRRKRDACLGILFVVPLQAGLVLPGASLVRDAWEGARYRREGLVLVPGCNGGAANNAAGQLHQLEQCLERIAEDPEAGTNGVAVLTRARDLAREQERRLSEDCRRRGHRENRPWRPEWREIHQVLDANSR